MWTTCELETKMVCWWEWIWLCDYMCWPWDRRTHTADHTSCRGLLLSERWACFVVRWVPACSYYETKTGYLAGIPRLLFSPPRHLYQQGTRLAECIKKNGHVIHLSPRRHSRKCQFYSIGEWKDCVTHFNFPSHILSAFLLTLFSFLPTCDLTSHLFTFLLVLFSQ